VAISLAWAALRRPRIVVEQREQLSRHEAHLARQLHRQLAQVDQPDGARRIQHDHGLRAKARRSLVPPKLKTSTPASVVNARNGTSKCRSGIPQPGTVHVQRHAVLVGEVGDRTDLVGRVQRAQFGGLGDAHRERLRPVLVAPPERLGGDRRRVQLAVGRRGG
jgi:hypothetical protein